MSRTAASRFSGDRGRAFHISAVHPIVSCLAGSVGAAWGACGAAAAPSEASETVAAPRPASMVLVKVRRFTECDTDDLASRTLTILTAGTAHVDRRRRRWTMRRGDGAALDG